MMHMFWSAALLAVGSGCQSAPTSVEDRAPRTGGQELRESTRSHYGAATELQGAIVYGRFTDVRALAGWIELNANPRSEELTTAASQISNAPDVKTAAALLGVLAGACVSCHTNASVRPVLATPPEPAAPQGMAAQMQHHQWAAIRLWAGVIGPNDDAWLDGARAMSNLKIDLAATRGKPTEVAEVGEDAELMGTLATRATATTNHRDRATVYGFMLHTCANCHLTVRVPDQR